MIRNKINHSPIKVDKKYFEDTDITLRWETRPNFCPHFSCDLFFFFYGVEYLGRIYKTFHSNTHTSLLLHRFDSFLFPSLKRGVARFVLVATTYPTYPQPVFGNTSIDSESQTYFSVLSFQRLNYYFPNLESRGSKICFEAIHILNKSLEIRLYSITKPFLNSHCIV